MNFLELVCLFAVIGEIFGAKNTPCPQVKLKFGRVRIRQRGRLIKFFCNTGYVMAGEKYSICVQGEWDTPFPKCVRPTCLKPKPPANGLIYPSHGGGVLNFYCMPGFEVRGHPVVYCDGRRWDNNSPTCLPTNTKPASSCNFETEDLCGWTHDFNHDFDWRRLNFKTPSSSIGTGPSFDHTKGAHRDGYYMYIESSSRNVNDTARLISPLYDKTTTNTCFEFYYHMFGLTIGELRVYLKKASADWYLDPSTAFFRMTGNQGNYWYRSITELGAITEDFQIVIEGVRGRGYVSDIAIDDVRLLLDCDTNREQTSTSTEYYDTEEPFLVESCENRCDEDPYNSTTSIPNNGNHPIIACDCDTECYYRSRCCPDYFDICIGYAVTDGEYTTETTEHPEASTIFVTSAPEIPWMHSENITRVSTPVHRYTNTEVIETTPKPIVFRRTTQDSAAEITAKSKELNTEREEIETTEVMKLTTTVVKPTIENEVSTQENNDIIEREISHIIKEISHRVKPAATSKDEVKNSTIDRQITTHFPRFVTTKKPVFYQPSTIKAEQKIPATTAHSKQKTISIIANPSTPYNLKPGTITESDEVELIPDNTDEGIFMTVLPSKEGEPERRMDEEAEKEINKNFFSRGSKEEIIMKNQKTELTNLNIIIGCVVLLMLLVVVGIVVGYRRYRSFPMSISRLMKSRRARVGSTSDVIFLTSDEKLDFSLNFDEL